MILPSTVWPGEQPGGCRQFSRSWPPKSPTFRRNPLGDFESPRLEVEIVRPMSKPPRFWESVIPPSRYYARIQVGARPELATFVTASVAHPESEQSLFCSDSPKVPRRPFGHMDLPGCIEESTQSTKSRLPSADSANPSTAVERGL